VFPDVYKCPLNIIFTKRIKSHTKFAKFVASGVKAFVRFFEFKHGCIYMKSLFTEFDATKKSPYYFTDNMT